MSLLDPSPAPEAPAPSEGPRIVRVTSGTVRRRRILPAAVDTAGQTTEETDRPVAPEPPIDIGPSVKEAHPLHVEDDDLDDLREALARREAPAEAAPAASPEPVAATEPAAPPPPAAEAALARRTKAEDDFDAPPLTRATARTIADLQTLFPDLRNPGGLTRLRVERLLPKRWQGVGVSGFLGWETTITDEQFAAKYGGERFRVQVYGPAARGPVDPGGGPRIQMLASIEFDIPGLPNLGVGPVEEQQPMVFPNGAGFNPMGGMWPGAGAASAQQRAASAEEARVMPVIIKEVLQDAREARKAGAADPGAAKAVAELSKDAMDRHESLLRAQMDAQAKQLDEERAARQELQRRLDDLSRENPQTRLVEALVQKSTSSQDAERTRADYERRIESLEERHKADVAAARAEAERIRADYERRIESLEDRHKNDLRVKEQLFQQQLEAMKGEAERRESAVRGEAERRERSMSEDASRRERWLTETFEKRLEALAKERERDLDVARRERDRDLDAARKDAERDLKAVERSHEQAQKTLEKENARLATENARLTDRLKDLEAQVHKPFLQEVQEFAAKADVLGWEKKGEGEQASQGSTIKEIVAQGFANALPGLASSVAPLLVGGLGAMGGGKLPQAGAPALPPHEPPAVRVVQPPLEQPAPRRHMQHRPRPAQAEAAAPPPAPQAMQPNPTPPPPPAPPPAQAPPATALEAGQGLSAEQQQEIARRRQQIGPKVQTKGPKTIPDEFLVRFAQEAENAYNDGTSPSAFAEAFVGQVGPLYAQAIDWVDGPNAALVMQFVNPLGPWDMEGAIEWVGEVWRALERRRESEAKAS